MAVVEDGYKAWAGLDSRDGNFVEAANGGGLVSLMVSLPAMSCVGQGRSKGHCLPQRRLKVGRHLLFDTTMTFGWMHCPFLCCRGKRKH